MTRGLAALDPWADLPPPPEPPEFLRPDGRENAQRMPTRAEQLRALLMDDDALAALPPPEWLIRDWIPTDGLVWSSGKPGRCKTMVAIDQAACIANGIPWHGHETKQGRVLYVIAEGARGVPQRVEAWRTAHDKPDSGITWLAQAVQFGKAQDVDALVEIVAEIRPVLIVLDTQARVTVGLDEDSNTAMGPFVEALDQLRVAAGGATIYICHHEPHNTDRLRGASALIGAASAVIRCDRDGRSVTVESIKQKDGEDPPKKAMTLESLGASVYLSDSIGHVPGNAGRVLSILISNFGDNGVKSGDLKTATGLESSSYQAALKTLKTQGRISEHKVGRNVLLYPTNLTGEQQIP